MFSLAFAGHTHGGQLRLPGRFGLTPVVNGEAASTSRGVHRVGQGSAGGVQGSGHELPALPASHQAGGDTLAIGINFGRRDDVDPTT